MIKGGFGRRAHVDMRMRSAHPRSDAGATPLRTLSAPAWHWQHTRHVRFGRERGRVLSYRFAAAHLAGPQLRDIDLPIDLSHGRAANRATAVPFGRWWTGRPTSYTGPTLETRCPAVRSRTDHPRVAGDERHD